MSNKSPKTVRDAAQAWLRRCALEGLERATMRSYKGHVKHHIEPRIGSLRLEDLKPNDVREFLDAMLEESTLAMARKCLCSLRAILAEAQIRGMVQTNVAREVKLRRQRRIESERVIPTKQEIRSLIEKAPAKHKPFIATAIFTGMRASELRGLRWENVDFEKKIIRVRERADRYNELGPPKSRAGRRDIPMAPMVYEELKDWRSRCPKGFYGLVFPNGAGNVESHANIYHRVFKPLMRQCGITTVEGKPRFGIHSLRHAAASLFIEQGWSPKKIQTMLGHASVTMTFDVYGHLFNDTGEDIRLMEKMQSDLLAA